MNSMRSKLWIAMMALILMMLVLLWLFQVVFLESIYTSMHITQIKRQGRGLVESITEVDASLEERLDAFSYNYHLNVEVLSSEGYSLYHAGNNAGQMMMMNHARTEAFKKALNGNEAALKVEHPRFGNKMMILALPIRLSGQIKGVLLIDMPIAPVEETASILKKQLLYITIILLGISLIMSYLLSRSFTSPLLEIKRVSEKMAKGEFSARIHTRKKDEIGQLAQTVNDMGDQLGKTEALRRELIANVSHELRTPLSLIRGYAETIRDVSGSIPEKRDRQVGIIIEETERLSRIVEDMLNLSRMQSGYYQLNQKTIYLKELLQSVKSYFTVVSETTGIAITVEEAEDYWVEADEDKIKQVFYNLINNSINHTAEGGAIGLSYLKKDGRVRISVSDTGCGISEEELPHIFDRYYQSSRAKEKRILGSGLGLAIVKSILDAHGSSYGAQSKLGEGTVIWFELKIANEDISS